ncbi:hypothetical protein DW081_03710 [Clostridium sp. AF46-9NS]|nr:hypothetical protein DW081_03710 [Clostridium sp. AF46-9NS]RGF36929.1 hypothetical protein DW076_04435 [Clostridium sp. AF46-12NS]
MIFSNDLVTKSMRLPPDIVEYIEQQEGDTFTAKFIDLVYEIMNGDKQRAENLAWYESTIEANRQKIAKQNQEIYQIQRVLLHLHHAVDEIDKLPFT